MAARENGLDGIIVTEWPALPGALAVAAAVAARVADISVAAETITRLTISYLVLPGDAPAEILAVRLADLARKLLGKDPQ